MKKILVAIMTLALISSSLLFSACGEQSPAESSSTSGTTSTSSETSTSATTSATTSDVTVEPTVTNEKPLSKDSIKILAIGNSFSVDSMEYLYGILKDCGAKSIFLANMYIGGCSLSTHAGNAEFNVAAYQLYTNSNGTWNVKNKATIDQALYLAEWDFISLQQVSGYSGMPDSYEPDLTFLIEYIHEVVPNAKLIWNMTWAYQGNSTHSDFIKYANDQNIMYGEIVYSVKQKVEPHTSICEIIPTGTAIQNLRTSFVGDNVTRDGYHLDYGFGRYTAAMAWAKAITGWDIDGVTYMPKGYDFSPELLGAIKEAVNNAVETPYAVTASTYTNSSFSLYKPDEKPDVKGLSTDEILRAYGYDPASYTKLSLDITNYAYYNSTSGSLAEIICAKTGSTASNLNQFAATKHFSKSDLPAGTLIVVKDGYQYRPEGWTSLTAKTKNRPTNVTDPVTLVDDAWWESFTVRAFNIAMKGNPALTEPQMNSLATSFAIYVPN